MPTFIAMLRGVNVGGNMLRMERLREVCSELGFREARTYVQSGNVVFESDRSEAAIVEKLETRLAGECRLAPSVVLRSSKQLREVISANPFLKVKEIDPLKLYVTFLAKAAGKDGAAKLSAIEAGDDRFHIAGKEIYLHCPVSYGETKLSNNSIQKALGVTATTRNWKTVNELVKMAT